MLRSFCLAADLPSSFVGPLRVALLGYRDSVIECQMSFHAMMWLRDMISQTQRPTVVQLQPPEPAWEPARCDPSDSPGKESVDTVIHSDS